MTSLSMATLKGLMSDLRTLGFVDEYTGHIRLVNNSDHYSIEITSSHYDAKTPGDLEMIVQTIEECVGAGFAVTQTYKDFGFGENKLYSFHIWPR